MADKYNILEDAVRDMYARAVWSHKIQEKQADIYQKQHKRMVIANIFITALTSAGIISTIFCDQFWIKLLSTFLSFASIFFTLYLKLFDLNNQMKAHKDAANNILIVRNEIFCLITSIKLREKSISDLEDRYHELMDKANMTYKEAPSTTDKAVKLAKKALQVKGDNTFSAEEIDLYLPPLHQKGGKK